MLAFLAGLILATSSPAVLTAHLIVDPIEVQKEAWIEALHQCENPEHIQKIVDTNGYYSYSDFMFQMSTWLAYGKKFGATKKNIYDNVLQRKVVRSMLDDGGKNHWYWCSKYVEKKLGLYPASEESESDQN